MGRKNRREKIYIRPLPTLEQITGKRPAYTSYPRRMEVWFAELDLDMRSSVQGGGRPVLIVSNDYNNQHSSTVTVIPLTSKMKRPEMPTHTWITSITPCGIEKSSMVLAEQITTVDKKSLKRRLGVCKDPVLIDRVEASMRKQLFTTERRSDHEGDQKKSNRSYV